MAQSKENSKTVFLPILAFLSLGLLVLYQSTKEINLCKDGLEVRATIKNFTTGLSEDHYYGRRLKVYNVELSYSVTGELVSGMATFNDGEIRTLFASGLSVGEPVSLLVDEDRPKQFKLILECNRLE